MIGCRLRPVRLISGAAAKKYRRDRSGSAILLRSTARGAGDDAEHNGNALASCHERAGAAGAAAVSAGLRRLPQAGLAARRAVRRLLAEAAVSSKSPGAR